MPRREVIGLIIMMSRDGQRKIKDKNAFCKGLRGKPPRNIGQWPRKCCWTIITFHVVESSVRNQADLVVYDFQRVQAVQVLESSIGQQFDLVFVQHQRVERVASNEIDEEVGFQGGNLVFVQMKTLRRRGESLLVRMFYSGRNFFKLVQFKFGYLSFEPMCE